MHPRFPAVLAGVLVVVVAAGSALAVDHVAEERARALGADAEAVRQGRLDPVHVTGLLHGTAAALGLPPCSPTVVGALDGTLPTGSSASRRGDRLVVRVPGDPSEFVIGCA